MQIFICFKKIAPLDNLNKCNVVSSSGHSGGDWLGKQANIKVENNGTAIYVGSYLTCTILCFFFSQIVTE